LKVDPSVCESLARKSANNPPPAAKNARNVNVYAALVRKRAGFAQLSDARRAGEIIRIRRIISAPVMDLNPVFMRGSAILSV